ncbi:hypothetical protein [Cytobacillus oceanisediminis]|uniref:hypothetical protein n=1 Tax=Cytobacillus oceanisediminis TaxID=665099 RepID=UPI001FB42A5B|nr:hypothetical protein [Cytobacillus oceanisediminis]UOE58068.1 hypothetical protein IRB79_27785 [Cytobacillus oceanisediminis]
MFAFLLIAAGCSQEKEANKTSEPVSEEKENVESESSADEGESNSQEVEDSEDTAAAEGFEVNEVISLPLNFQVSNGEFDPKDILNRDIDDSKQTALEDNARDSAYVHSEMKEYHTGTREYKQINMLEILTYERIKPNQEDFETARRYILYHGVTGTDSVEKPIGELGQIGLYIRSDESQKFTMESDIQVDSEFDGMELRMVDLYMNQLFFIYTEPGNKVLENSDALKTLVVQREINSDGTLGEQKKVAYLENNDFYWGEVIPSTSGLAAYDLDNGVLLLNGSNQVIPYSVDEAVLRASEDAPAIFFDEEKKTIFHLGNEDYIEEGKFAILDINTNEQVELQTEFNEMGYAKIAYAGYDPEKKYHYILGLLETDYDVQGQIHTLDENYQPVGDIYPVNTNTDKTSLTENGIILWSKNVNMDPYSHTASRVPFIGTFVDPNEFNIHD